MNGRKVRKSCTSAFKSASAFKDSGHGGAEPHSHEATMAAVPRDREDFGQSKWTDEDNSKAKTKLKEFNNENKPSGIQKVQSALTGVELIPDAGPVAAAISSGAGVVNGVISLGRTGYHLAKGEKDAARSNFIDAGLSAAGAIPLLGYGATVAKANKIKKASNVAAKYGQARHLDDVVGTGKELNIPYWRKK